MVRTRQGRRADTTRDAYRVYIVNAAHMLEREAEVGSLEPGKAANIVVLDRRLDDSSSSADVLPPRSSTPSTMGRS